MSQAQSDSKAKKTGGFLVFALGCMIAISGAAKLHPQDNLMRTRNILEGVAKRTLAKKLGPVVAQAQAILVAEKRKERFLLEKKKERLLASKEKKKVLPREKPKSTLPGEKPKSTLPGKKPKSAVVSKKKKVLLSYKVKKRSEKQLKALFQKLYMSLLRDGVKILDIRDTIVMQSQLSPHVVKAILVLWKQKSTKEKKFKVRRGDIEALGLKVLGDVVRTNLALSQKGVRGSRASLSSLKVPRAVRKIVSLLRDKVIARLVPYVLLNSIKQHSHHIVSKLSLSLAPVAAQELTNIGMSGKTMKQGLEDVAAVVSGFARSLGKKLGLKSQDFALRLAAKQHLVWTKRLAPALSAEQSLRFSREIAQKLAMIVAKQYAPLLAADLATRMRLEWESPSSSTNPTARRHSATRKPVLRRTPTARQAPAARQTPAVRQTLAARQAPTTRRVTPRVRAIARPTSQPTSLAVVLRQTPPPVRRRVVSVVKKAVVKKAGLLVLGAKSERIGGWPDSIPIFLFGVLLAVLGLLTWKRGLAIEVSIQMAHQAHHSSNPFSILANVQTPLKDLQADFDELNIVQVCERVDEILAGYIWPFAEVRRGVIDRLGMDLGAEILVVVAYGERMLNRVWSAASDGHLGEAFSVLPDAISAFEEAATLAKKADALPEPSSKHEDTKEEHI